MATFFRFSPEKGLGSSGMATMDDVTGKISVAFQWLAICGFGLFLWPMVRILGELYSHHDELSHGFLVPIISAFLIWIILRKNPVQPRPRPMLGITFLSVGISIVVVAYWYIVALLPNASLGAGTLISIGILISILGLTLLLGGLPLLKAIWFPLAYFGFAVPPPSGILKELTLRLRELVSVLSEFLLQMLNIPVYRQGNLLTLENATLGVADACSGIQSLGICIASAAALAWFFRSGLPKGILLCLLAVVLAIFSNLLRVTATAFLVVHFGAEWTEGVRHEVIGMLAFGISMFLLAGAGLLLSSPEGESAKKLVPGEEKKISSRKRLATWGMAAILLGLGIHAKAFVGDRYDIKNGGTKAIRHESHLPLRLFPTEIGNFVQVAQEFFPDSQMHVLRPEDSTIRVFKGPDGHWIRFWILKYLPGSYSPGIHQPDSCYPAVGYEKIFEKNLKANRVGLNGGNIHLRLFEKNGVQRAVLFWFGSDSIPLLPPKGIFPKVHALMDSLHSRPNQPVPSFLLSMETDVEPNVEVANNRLFGLAREMGPHLGDFGISWDHQLQ